MNNRFNIGDMIMYSLPEYASDEKIYFLIEDMKGGGYLLRNLNTGETGWKRGLDFLSFYKKVA